MTETDVRMLLVEVPDGPKNRPFFDWVRMIDEVRKVKVTERIVVTPAVIRRKIETKMVGGTVIMPGRKRALKKEDFLQKEVMKNLGEVMHIMQ